MRLRAKEKCVLHGRFDCCGRAEAPQYFRAKHSKWETVRTGVRRFWDENLGKYRWKLSDSERKKVIDRKLRENGNTCGICDLPIDDYRDVVPDHVEPKGMGGARADDGENGSNLQPAHRQCNLDKGSQRNFKKVAQC